MIFYSVKLLNPLSSENPKKDITVLQYPITCL
jgi:hypothetical protein